MLVTETNSVAYDVDGQEGERCMCGEQNRAHVHPNDQGDICAFRTYVF